MSLNNWNNHYNRNKSKLLYPDENLVRLLAKSFTQSDNDKKIVADIGCGSGRHLNLLAHFGFTNIIGIDYALNSLTLSKDMPHSLLLNTNNEKLCLKDNCIDAAICWGSLHYSNKNSFKKQLSEVYRILKKDAVLFGTLRSSFDTFMQKGEQIEKGVWATSLNDIKGSVASFYTQEELLQSFSCFSQFEYGIMERTLLGNMNEKISHWYYKAIK